jgi:hypothetical protein
MKKITLLSFLLMTVALFTKAQINNGRFESWTSQTVGNYTYDSLNSWKTTEYFSLSNSGNTNHSAVKETSEVYEGSSSIRLISWSTTGFPVNGLPGCATNGDVVLVPIPLSVTPVGGVPDVVRHAALMGYYEYIPMGVDHGTIETCLFKWNGTSRDTVAYVTFDAALNVGTYQHFVAPLTEVLPGNPDSSLIWIQSSPRSPIASGVTGTIMRIDSLYYSGLIGVDEISPLVKVMLTYPVPAVNEINVKVELVSQISMRYEILDNNGNIVLSNEMLSNTQKVDVSKLATGNYFVNLRDLNGNKLCSDRFTIVR